jgi:hypothetical protein
MVALDEELHQLPEIVAYQRELAAAVRRRAA